LGHEAAKAFSNKAGAAGWELAQSLWNKLVVTRPENTKTRAAVGLVAADAKDADAHAILQKVLLSQLERDVALAKEITKILGMAAPLQRVDVARTGHLKSADQENALGSGKQEIKIQGKAGSITQKIK
jgi:hypothetical protein